MEESEYQPVFVFIDGIFGGGISNNVRNHLRKKYPAFRFLDLSCGPVSSVADRAAECFYELYGGRVDYSCGLDGETLEKGHDRYGRLEAGLLGPSNWSETAPIHIFAYSLGAPTARFLQYLLAKQVDIIPFFRFPRLYRLVLFYFFLPSTQHKLTPTQPFPTLPVAGIL